MITLRMIVFSRNKYSNDKIKKILSGLPMNVWVEQTTAWQRVYHDIPIKMSCRVLWRSPPEELPSDTNAPEKNEQNKGYTKYRIRKNLRD